MNSEIKISVIIPCFNAGKYIKECVESVLNQELSEIEVICVDDGSTDDTLEILERISKVDNRVMVISQNNKHAGVARNRGLHEARGEYVHFLDSDDYVLENAYSSVFLKCKIHNLDVLRFTAATYDEKQKEFIYNARSNYDRLHMSEFNRLIDISTEDVLFNVQVAPWAGLYKRSFLVNNKCKFNDLICCNDRAFFNKVITNAKRIMCTLDTVVVYRVNQNDSLIGKRAKNFECIIASIKEVESNLDDDRVEDDISYRVMEREYEDMFVWAREYARYDELRTRIFNLITDYVENYFGKYRDMLKYKYNLYCEALPNLVEEKRIEDKIIPFKHTVAKKPIVTVITVVEDKGYHLDETLHTLVSQSLDELEIIVIGKKEDELAHAVIEGFKSYDERILYLGVSNDYYKTINDAISGAKGKYIGIIKSGDFVARDTYNRLYNIAENEDAGCVISNYNNYEIVYGKGKYTKVTVADGDDAYDSGVEGISYPKFCTFGDLFFPGIVCKSIVDTSDLYFSNSTGPYDLVFKIFTVVNKRYICPDALFNKKKYIQNTVNYTGNNRDLLNDLEKIYDWLGEKELLNDCVISKYYDFKWEYIYRFTCCMLENRDEITRSFHEEFNKDLRNGMKNNNMYKYFFSRATEMVESNSTEDQVSNIDISVVIPVYNKEQYLALCLDSVLKGNMVNIEVICVDDGSNDLSLNILREYSSRNGRVIVIEQENQGPGIARNTGLDVAQGKYIIFLDADDIFEVGFLDKIYYQAEGDKLDIIVFPCDIYNDAELVVQSGVYSINYNVLPKMEVFSAKDIKKDIFRAFVGWPWDKLFRRDLIINNHLRYPGLYSSEDLCFVYPAILKAGRIGIRKGETLAHHRKGIVSVSTTRENNWQSFYKALCILRKQLIDWNIYESYEQDFINYCINFSMWNLMSLKEPAYSELYNSLPDILEELGVTKHSEYYFYYKHEYMLLSNLLILDKTEFLFREIDYYKKQLSHAKGQQGKK